MSANLNEIFNAASPMKKCILGASIAVAGGLVGYIAGSNRSAVPVSASQDVMSNVLCDDYIKLTDEELTMLANIRHDIHQNPELAFNEYRTREIVRDFFTSRGVTAIRDVAKTGL